MSFILMSGIIFKLFNKGATFYNIGEIILLITPESLSFSMPLALLVATMLTYSRLSSDSELTAMRSSGINMWQIISPPLLLSIIIAIICFFLQFYLIPNCKYELRTKIKSIALENPSLFIMPEESVRIFNNQFIYVDKKDGNQLTGVFIKIFDKNERIIQTINAKSGSILYNKENHRINLPLQQVTILNYKYTENRPPSIVRLNAEKWQFIHQIQGNQQPLLKRDKYLDLGGILVRHRLLNEQKSPKKNQDFLAFQIHKKMALSLSALALVMISLNFGLQSGRREVGYTLLLTMGLALSYFVLIAISSAVLSTNATAANILIWLPNIVYQVVGIFGIRKISST